MKTKFAFLLLVIFVSFSSLSAQNSLNRYETELLTNPNPGKKDTREVNAVVIFEKDSLRIFSRRNKEMFKEFNYSDIDFVEHSFSREPFFQSPRTAVLMSLMTGFPLTALSGKEKHWLTVGGKDDFAVLKIENDNYRLLKMEFFIRKINVENVNENKP